MPRFILDFILKNLLNTHEPNKYISHQSPCKTVKHYFFDNSLASSNKSVYLGKQLGAAHPHLPGCFMQRAFMQMFSMIRSLSRFSWCLAAARFYISPSDHLSAGCTTWPSPSLQAAGWRWRSPPTAGSRSRVIQKYRHAQFTLKSCYNKSTSAFYRLNFFFLSC